MTAEYKSPEALKLSPQILGLLGQNEQTQNQGGRISQIYLSAPSSQDHWLPAETLVTFSGQKRLFCLSFVTFSKGLGNCHFNIFITLTLTPALVFPFLAV